MEQLAELLAEPRHRPVRAGARRCCRTTPAGSSAAARGRRPGQRAGHRALLPGGPLQPQHGAEHRPRRAGEELERLKEQLGRADLPPELNEQLAAVHRAAAARPARDDPPHGAHRAREARPGAARAQSPRRRLAEKSFYYLSEDELRRMREAVTKLAQRLKNVVSIRRKRGKRGKFDLNDTLRKNLQYGGVPFRIQFDRRIRDKPQVLVLCDVSDSVRNVSRFMLQFVYSLQDLYSRVRSFIFVSEIGEITQLFEENDTQRAIELALTGIDHQRLRPLRFRPRLQDLSPRLSRGGEQPHDGDRARRRAQQLQPAARVGAARRAGACQAAHLAQSGEPSDLGLRRSARWTAICRSATWSRNAAISTSCTASSTASCADRAPEARRKRD